MKSTPAPILSWNEAVTWREQLRVQGLTLVFSNGVFDLLHRGHVDYLFKAREFGDRLLVGLNADDSTRRLKGPTRPLNSEDTRARILSALRCVDGVVIFSEDTPLELILALQPDVLVKGADYKMSEVVGQKEVTESGGRVELIPLTPGESTTEMLKSITDSEESTPS